MARIDALLQHMTQSGATRAVLNADAPAVLESSAGTKQGQPMAGAQIQAMLDEIMSAQARQDLVDSGRAEFSYQTPAGIFDLAATQPNGQWHLEITPAIGATVTPISDVAAVPIVIAPAASTQQNVLSSAPESVELAKEPGPPRFVPSETNAPPPAPPTPATSSGAYAPAGNMAFNNDSGQGDASVLPDELRGFNWGALFGSWVWGLGNSVWLALLCLVPCVGFFMRFFLGAKGSEMAWKSKRWESIQAFRSAQVTWGVIGGLVTVGSLVFLVIPAAVLFPVFARARENARRSSCQSNLKQIGLAVMQFSVDHKDTMPVGTTMAEWKPQLKPYLTVDQLYVCPSHVGAGESYEINPKLSGIELGDINNPAETPMFYETKSDLHLDGSSILFADGHVKSFKSDRAQDVIKNNGATP